MRKTKNLIEKSFYKNGYTFEESLKFKNQIFDLFWNFILKTKIQYLDFLSKELNLMHLFSGILTKISSGIKYQKILKSLVILIIDLAKSTQIKWFNSIYFNARKVKT